jgi:hypothetical protein
LGFGCKGLFSSGVRFVDRAVDNLWQEAGFEQGGGKVSGRVLKREGECTGFCEVFVRF